MHIAVTGPESTGKTMLCEKLARYYGTTYIPEYARDYILKLNRPYNYDDVLHIAEKQLELVNEYAKEARNFLFYDTWLIITKVWFDVVFGHYPQWIGRKLVEHKIDLYLLCAPDIPWEPDPVRENGGKMREVLFRRYLTELNYYHCKYHIISGENRSNQAIKQIDNLQLQAGN